MRKANALHIVKFASIMGQVAYQTRAEVRHGSMDTIRLARLVINVLARAHPDSRPKLSYRLAPVPGAGHLAPSNLPNVDIELADDPCQGIAVHTQFLGASAHVAGM